jgi:hypothetical protein
MDFHVSDVLWASGITAVALLIQTWLTNIREERRLKAEASERVTESYRAREAALENHLRERRLEAYADFLSALQGLLGTASYTKMLLLHVGDRLPPVGGDIFDAIRGSWPRVQMLGSEEVRDAGSRVYSIGQTLWNLVTTAGVPGLEEAKAQPGDIGDAMDDLNAALFDFQEAARRDIGTEF